MLLQGDYSAIVLNGPGGEPNGEIGTWTNVYDQSIIVELPLRQEAKFVANFRYTVKGSVSESQYDSLTTGSYDSFDSHCDQTMVGFKLGKDKLHQCWVGTQTAPLTEL